MTEIKNYTQGNYSYLYYGDANSADFNKELACFFDRELIQKESNKLSTKGGRGKTLLFTMQGRDLVLRHYKRGGLWGKLVKDRFFKVEQYPHRAFDEFKLLDYMLSLGLPVPKPFIAKEVSTVFCVRNDIVIEQIAGSLDLSFVIPKKDLTELDYANIGDTIKRFFDAGINHTDLNIRNILMDESGKVYLIDFDKCFKEDLSSERKVAIVERLHRSFNKEFKKTNGAFHFEESFFDILRKHALA